MPLTASLDLDLIQASLSELDEDQWTDLLSARTDNVFLRNMFKRERTEFQSHPKIRTNVAVTPASSFEMVGLLGVVDNVNVKNHMTNFEIEWRRSRASWGVDAPEMSMNRGKARIYDLVKARRSAMWINAAEGIESQGWNQPADSNDVTNIYGIPTWVVPNKTAAGSLGGFNGTNPYGFSSGIGLNSSTYTRWANYTDGYSTVDKLDLIMKMRRAARLIDFRAPTEASVPMRSKSKRRGIYSTEFVVNAMELVLEQQNDNLGSELDAKGGDVLFQRTPVEYVPILNELSGTGAAGATGTFVNATYATSGGYAVNPVFMLDWACLYLVFLSGWYAREDGPYQVPGQRTSYATQVHWIWNLLCRDRRRQAVFTM